MSDLAIISISSFLPKKVSLNSSQRPSGRVASAMSHMPAPREHTHNYSDQIRAVLRSSTRGVSHTAIVKVVILVILVVLVLVLVVVVVVVGGGGAIIIIIIIITSTTTSLLDRR